MTDIPATQCEMQPHNVKFSFFTIKVLLEQDLQFSILVLKDVFLSVQCQFVQEDLVVAFPEVLQGGVFVHDLQQSHCEAIPMPLC